MIERACLKELEGRTIRKSTDSKEGPPQACATIHMPTHVNTHVQMGPHTHMHKKEEKTIKRLWVRTDNQGCPLTSTHTLWRVLSLTDAQGTHEHINSLNKLKKNLPA